jgi:hypothetical protein
MTTIEATAILARFFREEAGKVLPPEKAIPLLEAWALVEPELPDADSITDRWHILDVGQALEEYFNVPRDTLTDDQKREVLHEVKSNMDANCGINWHEIQSAIESLFSDVVEEAPKLEEEA